MDFRFWCFGVLGGRRAGFVGLGFKVSGLGM